MRSNDGFEYDPSLFQRLLSGLYRVINFFVPWHRLPRLMGAVNLGVLRDRLRAHNLHHTGYGVAEASPWVAGNERWRSADGSYNNLAHPRMGMVGTRFGRNVPLDEAAPDPMPALLDPNPRLISREILARDTFKPATTLNLLAAAWIQFETHDWFSHGKADFSDPIKVPLPPDDDWPDSGNDNTMKIGRTPTDTTPRDPWLNGAPTYRNNNSHWWDGAQLYGNDRQAQLKVRAMQGGRLNIGNDGLLADDPTHPGIDFTGFNDNWWLGLSLLHNLFVREHNAIAAALQERWPDWSDEELFQRARLINAALMAKIHTVEWTPGILAHPALDFGMHANWAGIPSQVLRAVLGKNSEAAYGIPQTRTEQHSAPYALTEEFTAVYRLHPLIPDELAVRSLTPAKAEEVYPIEQIQGGNTRGLAVKHGLPDLYYSFGIANPGAITARNFPNFLRKLKKLNEPLMDLAAIDIMRDRERGVPRYNRFRELMGKSRVTSFEEVTSIPGMAKKLSDIYSGQVDRVDLLVGLLCEDLPKGFGFSDTAFRVFILMASRRLKSDRFYTDDFRPEVYTPLGMDWIQSNNMSSVLLRHVPQLAPALEGVANAFAPWNRL